MGRVGKREGGRWYLSSRFGGSAGRGLIWRGARVGIKALRYLLYSLHVPLPYPGQVVSLVSEHYILLVYAVLQKFEGQIGNGNDGQNVTHTA